MSAREQDDARDPERAAAAASPQPSPQPPSQTQAQAPKTAPPAGETPDAVEANPGPAPAPAEAPELPLRGHFDRADGGRAQGWAFDPNAPQRRLPIEIHCAEQLLATGVADRFRQDLLDAGIGDGYHAFELAVDLSDCQHRLDQLEARVAGQGTKLSGRPFTAAATPPGETSANRRQAETARLPAFDNTRDTRFFYPSASHAEALSRLFLLTQDRNMGIGVLTGEIGTGKTLLRTLLFARLGDGRHLRVSIENSLLDFDGLLLEILSQMRGERLASIDFPDRYSRLAELKRLLLEQVASRDRHLVLLIDEAQQLEPQTLEALKCLTNITSERQNFLTLILIGQPELRAQLRELPEVSQRVSLSFHLGGLDRLETGYYVRHRLRTAGFGDDVAVSDSALDLLYQTTAGIPREINRIGKLVLDQMLNQGIDVLDEPLVQLVIEDLHLDGTVENTGLGEP
jgi:general secretion pathway protein A